MKGIFVGRFQPPHLGHMEAVRFCLSMVEFLYIVVGSSQRSHEERNPFTVGERMEMLRLALKEEGIPCDRYALVPVPDVESHSLWVKLVKMHIPDFGIVFSNDPLTLSLFREEGIDAKEVPLKDRDLLSATEVRRRMIEGGDWEALVPKSVAKYIREMGGIDRLRALTG